MTNVLTLRLDNTSQAFFESMRKKHFPPERNQIPAHLTLFHSLPDTDHVAAELVVAAERTAGFRISITGLRSLGRGVAYKVASPALLRLQAELADAFAEDLIPQDRQRFTPHIVIQNKATPERARILLAELERTFHALEADALGLDLWHYLGGPWELAQTFLFSSGSGSPGSA